MARKRSRKATTPPPAPSVQPDGDPTDTLRIAISFKRPTDQMGLTQFAAPMNSAVVESFRPEPQEKQRAIVELEQRGFSVTAMGELTVSVRGTRADFEQLFGTTLVVHRYEATDETATYQARSFLAPPTNAAWNPDPTITALIDDAYIQWPHLYMNRRFPQGQPSPLPPRVGYHHLHVPGDVALVLNAARVHRQGSTGRGVKVAMIDSGFAHEHSYFQEMGYNSSVVLAPGATQTTGDGNGHGTGESANLFAIAPDITFIGVKLDNEQNPNAGASLLEGFQEAIQHRPQVISISLGYDLVVAGSPKRKHLPKLPNSLKALEAEIQAAVAAGIVVVFSAGNGHVAFPGMMPDVISAGGVFVAEDGTMQASDYASSFASKIYLGRRVPDFCGLVGMQPNAAYIMLPLPPNSDIDQQADATTAADGWGVFSGTSAAAPQLAGVCALLLQKNPGLTPGDIKAILRRSSRDVRLGTGSAASNEGRAVPARPGTDTATGSGLVDAFAAWQQS